MDIAGQWAERIARRFTPAEADFAAEVGMAYAAGGSRRKDLFPGYDAQPGAFGPGSLASDLPMILNALAQAGTVLRSLLGSAYVANALTAAGLVVALRQGREHRTSGEPGEQAGSPPADGSSPPLTVPSPPASEREAVEQSFAALRGRLTAAGFDQARADELAYGLLEELLSDAASASLFIDALTAVPEESPRKGMLAQRIFGRHKGTR